MDTNATPSAVPAEGNDDSANLPEEPPTVARETAPEDATAPAGGTTAGADAPDAAVETHASPVEVAPETTDISEQLELADADGSDVADVAPEVVAPDVAVPDVDVPEAAAPEVVAPEVVAPEAGAEAVDTGPYGGAGLDPGTSDDITADEAALELADGDGSEIVEVAALAGDTPAFDPAPPDVTPTAPVPAAAGTRPPPPPGPGRQGGPGGGPRSSRPAAPPRPAGTVPPPPTQSATPAPVVASGPTPAEEAGYHSGELVSGHVTAVDDQEVVVDLGEGRTGVIGRRHFSNDGKTDPSQVVTVGEEIETAVLVREDRAKRIVLSRTWAVKQRAWQRIEEAQAAGVPVSGTVTEVVKGGVVLDVGVRAFLPASQIELRRVDDLGSYVGQTVEGLVTEADKAADKVVVSRRALLRQHEKLRVNELLGELAPGQLRRGRVATVTDFGAFVDLGGVRGLLHLSELSWERVERTTDVVNVGDEIEVKVLSVKEGNKKISLSLRAVRPDPLRGVVEGKIVQGTVTRLVDFGAFVRIEDGVEGLVHVSELAEHRIHLPEEVVTPGDEVLVKVLRVDRRRRRLDLSVNQAVQF